MRENINIRLNSTPKLKYSHLWFNSIIYIWSWSLQIANEFRNENNAHHDLMEKIINMYVDSIFALIDFHESKSSVEKIILKKSKRLNKLALFYK